MARRREVHLEGGSAREGQAYALPSTSQMGD